MEASVQAFLEKYNHMEEKSKFLGMTFPVFTGLPVNALQAMGVTDQFIRDHGELVELVGKTPQMSIRQRMRYRRRTSLADFTPTETLRHSTGSHLQRQQCFSMPDDALDETCVSQGGSNPRSKSPDFAYRTPAVPADTLYNMC